MVWYHLLYNIINYIINKYFIEFIGTLFFIFVGIYTQNPLATGAALTVAIMLGNGHFNPVMTIVKIVSGKLSINEAMPFILSQIAGGLAALELFKRI